MTRFISSLLIVCILSLFLSVNRQEASAAAPLILIPEAVKDAAAAYMGITYAVGAAAIVLGYEDVGEDIKQNGQLVYDVASTAAKVAMHEAVELANSVGNGIVNITSAIKDFINGNRASYAAASSKPSDVLYDGYCLVCLNSSSVPRPDVYNGTYPNNGHSATIYSFRSGNMLKAGPWYLMLVYIDRVNGDIWGRDYFDQDKYHFLGIIAGLGSVPWSQQSDVIDAYLRNVSNITYVSFSKVLTETGSLGTTPVATLETVIPSTVGSAGALLQPPVTSYKPTTSDNTPLTYDWLTGNYTYTDTGLPYTDTDVVWHMPALPQIINGKVAVPMPIGGVDVYYPADDVATFENMDLITPVISPALEDFVINLPNDMTWIDMVYPADVPYQIDIVYTPSNVLNPELDMVIKPPDIAVVDPETGIITPTKVGTGTLTISDPAGVVPKIIEIPIVVANNTNLPDPPGGSSSPPPVPGGWNIFDWLKYLLDLVVWIILAIVYLVTLASTQLTQLNNAVGGLKTVLVTVFSTTPPLVWTLIGFAIVMSIISGLMRRK